MIRPGSLRSFWENASAISLSKVTAPVAVFILTALIARWRGSAELGIFAVALGAYTISGMAATMGMDNYLIREVSADKLRAKVFLCNGMAIGLVTSVLGGGLLLAGAEFLGYPWPVKKIIWLTSILLWPSFVNYLYEMVLIALQRARQVFWISLLRESVMLGLSILFLISGYGLAGVIWAIGLSRVGALAVYMKFMGIEVTPEIDTKFIKEFFRMVPVFFMIALLSVVFMEMDTLILSKASGFESVGFYSVAKKLSRSGAIFIVGFGTGTLAMISDSFLAGREKVAAYYRALLKYILGGSVLLAFAGFALAPWLVRLFFGSGYGESVEMFRILTWSVVPVSLAFFWSRFLIAGHRQDKDLWAIATGCLSLLVLGVWLARLWGGRGMALAVDLSAGLMAAVHYIFIRKYIFKSTGG